MAEWDEGRERERRAGQVRDALIEEIRDIQVNTNRVAVWAPQYLHSLDSTLAAGTPVAPEPWLEAVVLQPHVWNATVTSGGLDLFSVDTFLEVSSFYTWLTLGFGQIDQLRDLSESQLLPLRGEAPSIYYTAADTGAGLRFRPEYRWYPMAMRRLAALARCTTVRGDSALVELGATADSAHAGLSAEGC